MKWIPLLLLCPILPIGAADEDPAIMPFADSRIVSVVFETFSMTQGDAAKLVRAATPDSQLYQTCVDGVATQQAKQEGLTVIRMAAGTKATSRSVLERISPTEYEPPGIPYSIGNFFDEKTKPPLFSPAMPTSFRTRPLGFILEIRDGPFSNNALVSLAILPEWTRDRGRSTHGKGLAAIEMPELEKQELNFEGDLAAGVPTMLGTFNRAPALENGNPGTARVWFAFATARMIEP